MKKILILLITVAIMLILACDKTTESDSDNDPPTVAITNPADNSQIAFGDTIIITADADDNKGIKEVKFYIDSVYVGTDDAEPYEYEWNTAVTKDSTRTIFAKAWDNNDNSSKSEIIEVTITGQGPLTVTDIDGNVYQTVKIGEQLWIAENLKVKHFRNGDSIPEVTDNDDWSSLSTGAWCYYDNDPANGDVYGLLYNWYVIDDSRGLAPVGWHIPTDVELQVLIDYLDGKVGPGGKMKSTGTIEAGTGLWYAPNTGATNESGFTAVPGGQRNFNGSFDKLGYYASFWSSSEYDAYNTWIRRLYYTNSIVDRDPKGNAQGFSVRCIKD